jgi:hypothetical protein
MWDRENGASKPIVDPERGIERERGGRPKINEINDGRGWEVGKRNTRTKEEAATAAAQLVNVRCHR